MASIRSLIKLIADTYRFEPVSRTYAEGGRIVNHVPLPDAVPCIITPAVGPGDAEREKRDAIIDRCVEALADHRADCCEGCKTVVTQAVADAVADAYCAGYNAGCDDCNDGY